MRERVRERERDRGSSDKPTQREVLCFFLSLGRDDGTVILYALRAERDEYTM
jgi:hypothetical protein